MGKHSYNKYDLYNIVEYLERNVLKEANLSSSVDFVLRVEGLFYGKYYKTRCNYVKGLKQSYSKEELMQACINLGKDFGKYLSTRSFESNEHGLNYCLMSIINRLKEMDYLAYEEEKRREYLLTKNLNYDENDDESLEDIFDFLFD